MASERSNKLVFLWTCPRSCSSVFERSIATLSGTRVPITEPFSKAFYFGPQRGGSRNFRLCEIDPNGSYEQVAKAVVDEVNTGKGNEVIFVKDMAYTMKGRFYILEEWFSDAKHSFLIRDPKKAILSHYRILQNQEVRADGYVALEPNENGFRQLHEMYQFVKEKLDSNPVIVDADDLLDSPKQIMKAYCERVGMKYKDHMTSWKAGELPQHWKGRQFSLMWRDAAINSSGFIKTSNVQDGVTQPAVVINAIEENQPFYEKLYAARVKLV